LHLLGGEPRVAADYMKKIADGDLAVDVAIVGEQSDSLMASLKVMQLKLKNLVSAVRGGAARSQRAIAQVRNGFRHFPE